MSHNIIINHISNCLNLYIYYRLYNGAQIHKLAKKKSLWVPSVERLHFEQMRIENCLICFTLFSGIKIPLVNLVGGYSSETDSLFWTFALPLIHTIYSYE